MSGLVRSRPALQTALKLASNHSSVAKNAFAMEVYRVAYSVAYPKKFLNLFPENEAEKAQTVMQYNTTHLATKEDKTKLRKLQEKQEAIPSIKNLQIQYGRPFGATTSSPAPTALDTSSVTGTTTPTTEPELKDSVGLDDKDPMDPILG